MKRLQLPALKIRDRRSLLIGAAATAVGLALWGTAETTQPGAGEGPQLAVTAAPQPDTASSIESQPRIDFPRRAGPAKSEASLFSEHSWYVPPPPPPPAKPVPPPPPTAPPLPFSFLGSYSPSGSGAVYYLVRGDQVLDVKIGDTLDGVYSVDAVQNDELQLTYLPLKQRQALSLRR
jgi:hypothetical protein